MNHVSWSFGDHENNYLTTFLSNSTKYDIVVILVFFSELFDEYPIRGSMRKVFYSFLVGTACTLSQAGRQRHPAPGFGQLSNSPNFYSFAVTDLPFWETKKRMSPCPAGTSRYSHVVVFHIFVQLSSGHWLHQKTSWEWSEENVIPNNERGLIYWDGRRAVKNSWGAFSLSSSTSRFC